MTQRVHIIGHKNHGKTTLVCELIAALRRERPALKLATIKHTDHAYELDTPGKDSHRHRHAAAPHALPAAPAAFVAGPNTALYLDTGEDYLHTLAPLLAGIDLLIVEGDKHNTGPSLTRHVAKFEVWRAAHNQPTIARTVDNITALVTDDPVPHDQNPNALPVLPRNDLRPLLASIHARFGL